MSIGIEKCIAAFERLKNGTQELDKFDGIAPAAVTNSVVSQEAGFDSGYLKRSRNTHKPLISLIDLYREEHSGTTSLSKKEIVRRETAKTKKYLEDKNIAEERLTEALARELKLVCKLRELEGKVSKLENQINIVQFPER